jgi:hypothetical protein
VVETADGDKIGKWAWKPLFFILAANFTFGILLGGLPSIGIPAMGLIVGIYALTFIASLAGNEFNAKGCLFWPPCLPSAAMWLSSGRSSCSSLCGRVSFRVKQEHHHGFDLTTWRSVLASPSRSRT